ncbi:MAG: sodium:proton antiporter [bacterium]
MLSAQPTITTAMNNTADVPLAASLPFLLMLGAVAICPMFVEHFWGRNRNKLAIALLLSAPVIVYFLNIGRSLAIYESIVFDYVPFIILLGALFVITGGIHIDTDISGSPRSNTALLLLGTILASALGTTGAAMLLIRPLLHANRHRKFKSHTVLFFIATACNCGGLLTPLGDPPLFMMYLRGAPFEWFLRLWPMWAGVNALLLGIFYLVDRRFWLKEDPGAREGRLSRWPSISIRGGANFLWLAGILAAVAAINKETIPILGSNHYYPFAREIVILLMAGLSLALTTREVRSANHFNWQPITEVACIFLGVFITMVPCLIYLRQNASSLGISSPTAFYYASGFLSALLDNTPTALTFHSLALGTGLNAPDMVAGIPSTVMAAICCGAVFFGAMTYIGNGPNFMVKTIAEHRSVKMPGFFAYIWIFSLPVMLPVFALVQLCLL